MFSVGGALNELSNAANMAGGAVVTPRVGWQDPNSFWTAERKANWAKQQAGAPTGVYKRQEIGGSEAQFRGRGKGGTTVAGGYKALGQKPGENPRAPRLARAGLDRAAARGNAGWKAGGYA